MMEFIPEKIDTAVVINVMQKPFAAPTGDAPQGADYAVAIHNWLMSTQLRYVIFDLQDEKEVSNEFLEEILQLMRRLGFPFLFSGVMQKPRQVLESYDYVSKFPIFTTPEEAITLLQARFNKLLQHEFDGIQFGAPIEMVRSRMFVRPGEELDDGAAEGDLED